VAWYDNVPLLSYVLLGGRCRQCGGAVSIRYPLVEGLTGVFFVAAVARFGVEPMTFKVALFGSMMLVLFFTDLAEFILPDEITKGGAVIGLALSTLLFVDFGPASLILALTGSAAPRWFASLADAALSAVILGGVLLLIGEIYYRLRDVEGLGLGDVKMVAMMATFWGISETVLILIASSLIGALTGVLIVLIGRKQWHYALPFGSYLAATGIAVALWGDAILSWYWSQVLPPV
jgi:leader peptidase (prepilin peptidase)/N-methyltransferase